MVTSSSCLVAPQESGNADPHISCVTREHIRGSLGRWKLEQPPPEGVREPEESGLREGWGLREDS